MNKSVWHAIAGCLLRHKIARITWRMMSRIPPPNNALGRIIQRLTSDAMGIEPEDIDIFIASLTPDEASAAQEAIAQACQPASLSALHEELISEKLLGTCEIGAELLGEATKETAKHRAEECVSMLSRALRMTTVHPKAVGDIVNEVMKPMGRLEYLPSYCSRLRHGYPRRALSIVAARPGHGKTWWLINEALTMSKKMPGIFISREMTAEKIVARMLAIEAGLEADLIQSHRLGTKTLSTSEEMSLRRAAASLTNKPIIIIDGAHSIETIASVIMEMSVTHGIGWACVDYLQLITKEGAPKTATRREVVSAVSNELTRVAADANIAMLVASQLRRPAAGANDDDMLPSLYDLKETSDIEQDATLVIGLARVAQNEYSAIIRAEILKNREGRTGDVWQFRFDNKTCRFITDESVCI